jgi:mono/diheme cytochrome c family protein
MHASSRGPFLVLAAAVLLTLTACTTAGETTTTTASAPSTTEASTTPSAGDGATTTTVDQVTTTTPISADPFAGRDLSLEAGTHFAGSGACAVCHTRMTSTTGEDVSIDSTWRSSMMANAARDPYWQAAVRAEAAATPGLAEIIEDKCSTCHMPMARTTDSFTGTPGAILDAGYLDSGNALHSLAIDGVSCTTCHQIREDNLGTEESHSGGFLIDPDLPVGERITYGPFEVTRPAYNMMRNVSGYIPVESEHIQESAVCATCHTLTTPYVDSTGAVAGTFPEQMPFVELAASDVTQSCQDCHMPEADGDVILSIAGPPVERSNVSRHFFVGGNDFLLSIMSTFGEEMGLTASSDHVADTRERIIDQLTGSTASVTVGSATADGEVLTVPVAIASATGHKFPTGFPSRRAWLHVTVTDGAGEVVFESGGWTSDGAITANDNDADPTAYEPHYETVTDPAQVQIYETILLTTEGDVTTTLLRGASYTKDNRLLPVGFDKKGVPEEIAVHGAALQDADFGGGGDVVEYRIDTAGLDGPFRVEVELLYQTIAYRWANNLPAGAGPEIDTFLGYYEAVPNVPVVVGTAAADL